MILSNKCAEICLRIFSQFLNLAMSAVSLNYLKLSIFCYPLGGKPSQTHQRNCLQPPTTSPLSASSKPSFKIANKLFWLTDLYSNSTSNAQMLDSSINFTLAKYQTGVLELIRCTYASPHSGFGPAPVRWSELLVKVCSGVFLNGSQRCPTASISSREFSQCYKPKFQIMEYMAPLIIDLIVTGCSN